MLLALNFVTQFKEDDGIVLIRYGCLGSDVESAQVFVSVRGREQEITNERARESERQRKRDGEREREREREREMRARGCERSMCVRRYDECTLQLIMLWQLASLVISPHDTLITHRHTPTRTERQRERDRPHVDFVVATLKRNIRQ